MAKTWSIATHAFKALKRHARQSNKHGNGTEMAYRMIPNHQNNAKLACYTCTYSRPTSPKCKEAILSMLKSTQTLMDRPKA